MIVQEIPVYHHVGGSLLYQNQFVKLFISPIYCLIHFIYLKMGGFRIYKHASYSAKMKTLPNLQKVDSGNFTVEYRTFLFNLTNFKRPKKHRVRTSQSNHTWWSICHPVYIETRGLTRKAESKQCGMSMRKMKSNLCMYIYF